jgi:uncharacterized protein (TIGR00369 family)
VARDMDNQLGDGGMPLLAAIGLSFESYGDGWSAAAWTPTAMACNPFGIVHGGVYGVALDAAMNFALNAALDRGDRASTLQIDYSMPRGAKEGDVLRVRSEVGRLTRTVAFVEAWVRDADDGVVAHANATFAVRRRE